jgi:hypothetical protein
MPYPYTARSSSITRDLPRLQMVLASAEKIDADRMVQVEALRTPGTTMLHEVMGSLPNTS